MNRICCDLKINVFLMLRMLSHYDDLNTKNYFCSESQGGWLWPSQKLKMTSLISHLKKEDAAVFSFSWLSFFSGKKIKSSFWDLYTVSLPIWSSLIYSYQIFNNSGLLPKDCLSSDYSLSDNHKSDFRALYLIITNLVLPDATFLDQGLLPNWVTGGQNQGCTLGGCIQTPGEEDGEDTGLLQPGQNKTVLFLEVDQDIVIWSFIHQRWLWNQICTRSF